MTNKDEVQIPPKVNAAKIRIIIGHIVCLGVFFVPLTKELLIFALLGYFLRVFAYEGVAHRYFSHRSFKTTRVFQFALGVLQAASGQRGPIWWANHHRIHHKYSDGLLDPHSPVTRSFGYSFIGWLVDPATAGTDFDGAKDLSRFPELVWLNRYHSIFLLVLLIACFLVGQYTTLLGHVGLGTSAVIWLFFLPMLLAVYSASIVNALMHGTRPGMFCQRRFETGDTSTNCWWLAIPTMGASFHNNHHRYMNAGRAGFYWWELDLTYLVLKALTYTGLIWDLKQVPEAILVEGLQADKATSTQP